MEKCVYVWSLLELHCQPGRKEGHRFGAWDGVCQVTLVKNLISLPPFLLAFIGRGARGCHPIRHETLHMRAREHMRMDVLLVVHVSPFQIKCHCPRNSEPSVGWGLHLNAGSGGYTGARSELPPELSKARRLLCFIYTDLKVCCLAAQVDFSVLRMVTTFLLTKSAWSCL